MTLRCSWTVIDVCTYIERRVEIVVENDRSPELDFGGADVIADVHTIIALRCSKWKQLEAINCCDAV